MPKHLAVDRVEMDETEQAIAASDALAAQEVEAVVQAALQRDHEGVAVPAAGTYIESDSDDYLLPHSANPSSTQMYHDLGEAAAPYSSNASTVIASPSPAPSTESPPTTPVTRQLSATDRKILLARSMMLSRIGDFWNGSVAGINRAVLKIPDSSGSPVAEDQGSATPVADVTAIAAVGGPGKVG